MVTSPTWYDLIGVDPDASSDEVRAAWKAATADLDPGPRLDTLNRAGMKTAILSNGSPKMLATAVQAAGLENSLNEVISIEDAGIYKPSPSVYQLAVDQLGVAREHICFVSSNGWDATGAAAFGFQVAWVNRSGQKPETLGFPPKAELKDLTGLADLVIPKP